MFVPPVVKADCCLFSTVQAMMEHAAAEGWPHTIKGGRVMVDASLAEIQTVCLIGEPTVGSLEPDPITIGGGWDVYGANFGDVEGAVWLGSAATWEGSGTRVQQSVGSWITTRASMNPPVQGGLPLSPQHVYVYVINDCGERNAVGYETELFVP